MRLFYTLLLSLLFFSVNGQISFENFNIPQDSFINAATGDGFFEDGLTFSNDYNATYMSFNNFALSNKTDQVTAGFTNQYSVFSTSGANDSESFAIGYLFDGSTSIHLNLDSESYINNLLSIMVNNTTFAALSMLNGDGFAKKFGGESGTDPDFFLLKFDFYSEGVATGDTIGFFLADFRFEDNSMDYIVQDWTAVDFSQIAPNYDEVRLSLKSSDVGGFGMNTPAYVAIDEINVALTVNNKETALENVNLYPNPVTDILTIETEQPSSITIFSGLGSLIRTENINSTSTIDVSDLLAGTYFIQIEAEGKRTTKKLFKK